MKKVLIPVISIVGILVVLFGILAATSYNKLVTLDEDTSYKYSQISNNLKTRHDAIAQMVDAITGLQDYSLEVYNMITEARTAFAEAYGNSDMEGMIAADNLESAAMTQFFLLVEQYPEMVSAVSGYQTLLDTIYSIEATLNYSRQQYNLSVQSYNTTVRKFPMVLYASMFSQFPASFSYWELPNGEGDIPAIDFGN